MLRNTIVVLFGVLCATVVLATHLAVDLHTSCPAYVKEALQETLCYINRIPCLQVLGKIVTYGNVWVRCDQRLPNDVVAETHGTVTTGWLTTVLVDLDHYNKSSAFLQNTLRHEMGHVMGLPHSPVPGVMAPYLEQKTTLLNYSDIELSMLRSIHGNEGWDCVDRYKQEQQSRRP